ncbi:phage antirepressor N-terminal domain-containing protein, partial [Clostridium botulinum]
KDNRCDNVKLTNVINKNINDYENIINIFNYQQEKFNNIDIDVIDTEKGRVIPVSNIYNALGLSRQAVHQMLSRNKELFDGMVFNINMGDGDKICVNKEGIIGLLMKMQYERLKEDKKQLVLQFQKWCMKTLNEIVSNGKVELKDQERQEVKSNISKAIGLSDEDIDKLFGDIEELLQNKLHTLHEIVNELKDEKNSCKMIAESEKQRSERLIAKTVHLREKIYSVR